MDRTFGHLIEPRIGAIADEAAAGIEARIASGLSGEALLGACIDDLRASRYLDISTPTAYGGLGGSVLDVCLAQERVSSVLGSVGLAANMHLQYVGASLVSGLWRPDMLERFLRASVEHRYLINNCQAEHEMGSPARGGLPATTATRVAGGWRINGRKSWSTAAPFLTHMAVGATVRAPDMPEHLGQFLVTAASSGVRIERTWHALAMRESASHNIVFDDVFVPDEDVIRVSPTGETFTPSSEVAPWHGLPFAATYLGIAIGARDWVLRFAATRVPTNLGKPIGDLPAVRAKLGEIEALLLAARRVVVGAARDWVEGRADRTEIAAQVGLAKSIATNNAVRITDLALRVAGGVGLDERHPLERAFRDVRAGLIHPPLDDVAYAGAAARALAAYQERESE